MQESELFVGAIVLAVCGGTIREMVVERIEGDYPNIPIELRGPKNIELKAPSKHERLYDITYAHKLMPIPISDESVRCIFETNECMDEPIIIYGIHGSTKDSCHLHKNSNRYGSYWEVEGVQVGYIHQLQKAMKDLGVRPNYKIR